MLKENFDYFNDYSPVATKTIKIFILKKNCNYQGFFSDNFATIIKKIKFF